MLRSGLSLGVVVVALVVVGCGGGIDYTCADIEASSEKEAEADAYLVDKLNEALADAPESPYGDKGELVFQYTQGADAACAGIDPGPLYNEPAKPDDKVQPLLDERVRAGVNWYRTAEGLETGGNAESDQSSEEDQPSSPTTDEQDDSYQREACERSGGVWLTPDTGARCINTEELRDSIK